MKTKKQPVIGVTLCYGREGQLIPGAQHNLIRREYGEQLKRAGASPIFLDASIDPSVAAELCDGIIISGGEDIEAGQYGAEQLAGYHHEPSERTMWERELIRAIDARGKHILGICYGAQLLNVHYGGTLFQHIPDELPGSCDHGTSASPAEYRVRFQQEFLGFQAKDDVVTVHRHHQAVKELAPGFTIAAQTPDGVIEAIDGHGHYGVQWHAEADGTADTIYPNFVRLVTQRRAMKFGLRRLLLPQVDPV